MNWKRMIAAGLAFACSAVAAIAGEERIRTVREHVKDEYIVFLVEGDRHDVPALANALANEHNGKLIRVWNGGIQAFWVSMSEGHANAMLHNPHVAAIEENAVLHESESQDVGGSDPFWHLDRVDQRFGTDGHFQSCNGPTDVYAYIFDRGVRAADPQLNGRVQAGKNAAPADGVCDSLPTGCSGHTGVNDPPPYPSAEVFASQNPFSERNPCGEHNAINAGHGTAVATVLAGTSVGVARTAKIVPIRIANCQGDQIPAFSEFFLAGTSGYLFEAFNWFFDHDQNTLWDTTHDKSTVPAVANFSIYYTAGVDANHTEYGVETFIKRMIHGGVVVVVSANNQGKGDPATCTGGTCGGPLWQIPTRLSYSNPQPNLFTSSERVISVGGTTMNGTADKRWVCVSGAVKCVANEPGSNFGAGVDIWAPADNVQSGGLAFLFPGTGDTWPINQQQYRRPYSTIALAADGSTSAVYTRSGTSFSSPMVAGAAARLLSEDSSLFNATDPSATALTVWNRLKAAATRLDATAADLGAGSSNLFLYVGGVNFRTQPQSVTMTGSTATLTADAVGTAVTYRLFEGPSGNMSTPVGTTQSTGTFTVSPSSTKTYWIQATNTCPADGTTVTGDSAEATVTVSAVTLSSPAINARTQDTNSRIVHVTWSLVSGATSYRIERATCTGATCWGQAAVSNSATITSFDDTPLLVPGQPVTTYLYRVIALAGSSSSSPSAIDYATTATNLFNEPIVGGGLTPTPIRGSHVKELRNAIDAVRVAAGLSTSGQGWTGWPASYTDATGLIRGVDVGDMRRALDQAIATLKPASHFSPSTDPSGTVSSNDFNNLREAVR